MRDAHDHAALHPAPCSLGIQWRTVHPPRTSRWPAPSPPSSASSRRWIGCTRHHALRAAGPRSCLPRVTMSPRNATRLIDVRASPRRHYAIHPEMTGTIPTEVGQLTKLGFMCVSPSPRPRALARRQHTGAQLLLRKCWACRAAVGSEKSILAHAPPALATVCSAPSMCAHALTAAMLAFC